MTSYMTLVNVDAETALKVSAFVANLLPSPEEQKSFLEECTGFIESIKTSELIEKLLDQRDVIFTALTDSKDIENCFQAMFSVIYTLGDGGSGGEAIIKSIVAAITSDTEMKPTARLAVLVALLNITFDCTDKFEVLKATLSYASATQQTKQVVHFYSKLDQWCNEWELSIEKKRVLLQNMAAVLVTEGESSEALHALTKLFNTYSTSDSSSNGSSSSLASASAEVQVLVTTALVAAVKSPVAAYMDRSALLEALRDQVPTGKAGHLYKMLQLLCEGSVDDFLSFKSTAEAATMCKEHALDAEELERAMRLLSLCTVAASQPQQSVGKPLRREVLQAALKVEDAMEVELWVVEAIAEKLIDASIDQMSETVTITRYAHRSFGMQQWKGLQQQLQGLRKSVSSVIETIQSNTPAPVTTATATSGPAAATMT